MERRDIYAEVDKGIERARRKYPAGDADNRFDEIHLAWKVFFVACAFTILLMALGVL